METTDKIYGIALALTLGLAANVMAQGDLYFAAGNGAVDKYGLDGSTVNPSLFSAGGHPTRSAISGKDLFVLNGDGTIGEYSLSGKTVNASLIKGLNGPSGDSISGNDQLNGGADAGGGGESTTSGQTVHTSLNSGLSSPNGIAISRYKRFAVKAGNISSGATANASLVGPFGFGMSGNDLFAANGDGTIGEYTISGASIARPAILNGILSGNDLAYGATGVGSTSGGTAISSLISGLRGPYGMGTLENSLSAANVSGATDENTVAGDSMSAPLISGPASAAASISFAKHAPEPSSIALAGLSAAMMWLWRWRRR